MRWVMCMNGARRISELFHRSRTPALDFVQSSQISDNKSRVLRGGSFSYEERYLRCAFRDNDRPTNRSDYDGLRFARTYP